MQEEFITLETAQLAKAKGFSECSRAGFGVSTYVEGKIYGSCHLDADTLLAPTQSLLQKWIREKHQVHIVVDHYKRGHYGARISDAGDNSLSDEVFGETYKTYELALEAALYASLSYIKGGTDGQA